MSESRKPDPHDWYNLAEQIASSFLDGYHEQEGVLEDLGPDDDQGPRRNALRGALKVITDLGWKLEFEDKKMRLVTPWMEDTRDA